MKKSFVWASIILIGLLTGTKTEASARRFYLELLGAIDHTQAKARLFLDAGTWRSTVGDTEIKWIVKKATAAVTSLNYESGLLQNGQIIFEDPITAVLKRTVNGQVYCVVLTIKQIDYSDQGYIEPSSKLGEQPASPDCNARAGRAELQRVGAAGGPVMLSALRVTDMYCPGGT